MVEHLERVRAVHRDVHHLQLVRDRRDAAPVGNRHPARARRDARPDSHGCFSARARSPGSSDRSAGVAFGILIARGIAGVHRRADRRRLRRRAAGRRARDEPGAAGWRRWRSASSTSVVAAVDSGAQRGARRSGAGAAEGQVSGAVGRREPGARRCGGDARRASRSRASSHSAGSRLGRCSTRAIVLAIVVGAAARARCCRLACRGRFGRC